MNTSHDNKNSIQLPPLTLEFLRACYKGDKPTIYELLYKDVLEKDKTFPALSIYLAYERNHLDILKFLLLHGVPLVRLLPDDTQRKMLTDLKQLKTQYPEFNSAKDDNTKPSTQTMNFVDALILVVKANENEKDINKQLKDALGLLTPKDFVDLSAIVNAQYPNKKAVLKKYSEAPASVKLGEPYSYPVHEFPRVFFRTFELIKACNEGSEDRICELILYGALNENPKLNTIAFGFAQNASQLDIAKLLYLQGVTGSNALPKDMEGILMDYGMEIAQKFQILRNTPVNENIVKRFSNILDIVDRFIKYPVSNEGLSYIDFNLKSLTLIDIVDLQAIAKVLFPEKKSILDERIKKLKSSAVDMKEAPKPGLFTNPKAPLSPDEHRKIYTNLMWIKAALKDEKSFPLEKHKQARGLLKAVTLNPNDHSHFKEDVQLIQSKLDNLFSTTEMENLKDAFLNSDKGAPLKPNKPFKSGEV